MAEGAETSLYPVVVVDPATALITEQMGSKEKYWFRPYPGAPLTLFKQTRRDTGEDWAEKAAAEIASALGLPHAHYDLAESAGHRGIITPTIVGINEGLVHGNELLSGQSNAYAASAETLGGRTSEYTVDLALAAVTLSGAEPRSSWRLPANVTSAADLFVGYLMLDALVGNTDRHQENWGVLVRVGGEGSHRHFIAPLFDTASCLGRNEPDNRKQERLETKDERFTVEAYAQRARSPFYLEADSAQSLSVFDAFARAVTRREEAGRAWLGRLADLEQVQLESIFARFPRSRLSAISKEFAMRMIAFNKQRLLAL